MRRLRIDTVVASLSGLVLVDTLVGALDNQSPDVRVIAIQSLASLDAKEALPRLRSLLDDTEKSRFGDQVSVADAARAAIARLQSR